MKRINVSFYPETYEKLEKRMEQTNSKSIASSIRELVDLGLKIEEAAANNNQKNNEADFLESFKTLLKNNLIWSMETRLLARHLVEKNTSSESNNTNILEICKERAANYVMGMLGEEAK